MKMRCRWLVRGSAALRAPFLNRAASTGSAFLVAALLATTSPFAEGKPLIIAHRGASGERPEHTLPAYELAIAQGADYIEVDLVMTRDGVLVARHENEIGETTDVASRPQFAARRTTKTVDGQSITGWFVEDFSLSELKTLRAKERLPQLRRGNVRYDGQFAVPTLQEVIDLVRADERRTRRPIGLYLETKHSRYFRSRRLPLEEALVAVLRRNGYWRKTDPVFLQSFEVGNLQRLRRLTALRLVQLLADRGAPPDRGPPADYAQMATPAGLAAVARYADAIGPAKSLIVAPNGEVPGLSSGGLVANAHRAGLAVHAWTFRSENYFLPRHLQTGADPAAHGDAAGEYRIFLEARIDGFFTDFPAQARQAFDAANGRAGQPAGR